MVQFQHLLAGSVLGSQVQLESLLGVAHGTRAQLVGELLDFVTGHALRPHCFLDVVRGSRVVDVARDFMPGVGIRASVLHVHLGDAVGKGFIKPVEINELPAQYIHQSTLGLWLHSHQGSSVEAVGQVAHRGSG